jgi:uncharacterized protein (DUF58 family)
MTDKRSAAPSSAKPTWTEAVPPLSAADAAMVKRVVAEIAPEWSVELHGFCADEATLVLVPEDGDDAKGPSFLISRDPGGIKLDQIRWDELTEVGIFPSLQEAVLALAPRLSSSNGVEMHTSATVH